MEKPLEVSITCSINIWTGNELKNLLVCGLLVLMLIQSYTAIATIQLSGDSGRAILSTISNNASNQTLNASNGNRSENLWSWGTLPIGYTQNGSGDPVELPNVQESEWIPSI